MKWFHCATWICMSLHMVQQLFCLSAQVHLCHRETQPVISTNIAVTAECLPALEYSWVGLLAPLLSFLFFLSCLYQVDTLLSVQLSVQRSIPAVASLIKSCFGLQQLAVGLGLNSFRTVDTVTHFHEQAAHGRKSLDEAERYMHTASMLHTISVKALLDLHVIEKLVNT